MQYPLSLVSIKYKHFLLFGLGVPVLNTSTYANVSGTSKTCEHEMVPVLVHANKLARH